MIAVFGTPKYLLKCEATFCEPGEHWWAVIDGKGGSMCRVIMGVEQAKMCVDKEAYSIISAADYFRLLSKESEQ